MQSTKQDIRFVSQVAQQAVQAGGNVLVFNFSIQIGDISLSNDQQINDLSNAIVQSVTKSMLPEQPKSLPETNREYEIQVLEECGWHRKKAADRLKISCRTLRSHIAEAQALGIDVPDDPRWQKKGRTMDHLVK